MNGRIVRATHIVFDLEGGGLETLVAEMARCWSDGTDVRMSVITLGGRVGRVGETIKSIVDQYHVLRPARGLSMIAPLALVRAIRATRPDVVHLHSGAWYKGALAARLAGVARVIYTEHGREHNDPALVQWLDRIAARWTHSIVTVSDRLRQYMARVIRVDPVRVVTIHNGVNVSRFTPGHASAALRLSLGIPDDALVIGSIGRLEVVKAYERLVEAFARLCRDAEKPLALVIFGEGSAREQIQRTAEALGVGARVHLPGWTTDPIDGHRLLDVFALTSLSEGMSVSLMESMACGVCPVVMDVGSNAEVLGSDLAGQLVGAGDLPAFEAAVRMALTSSDHRRRVGLIARERAEANYSLDAMTRAYARVYRGEPLP